MAQFVLEQLSGFGDYNGSEELSEILGLINDALSDVRLSPDGRHVHVILRKPKAGLVTFDKYERVPAGPQPEETGFAFDTDCSHCGYFIFGT